MVERFQVSKSNGTTAIIPTITENVAISNEQNSTATAQQQQVSQARKSSRISFRGFGSFLKSKNSNDNDRKFSLAQLTQ